MTEYRLRVFVAVARHGNITRAARELHISQPSVSRHLKALQEEYGTALYRVVTQGIELTSEGKEFLQQAKFALAQFDRLQKTFKKRAAQNRTLPLRVGGSFGPSMSFLPSLLTAFKRSYPKIPMISKSGPSEELEQAVLKSELDLALITRPSHLQGMVYEPCGSVEVVAFVCVNHPLARKRELTLYELGLVPLILQGRIGNRSSRTAEQLRSLETEGFKLNIAMDCDSHRTLRYAVKRGMGVGFTYREYLATDIKKGRLKILKIPGFKSLYDTYVVYAKDKPLSPAAVHFLALVRRRRRKTSSLTSQENTSVP